MHQREPVRAGRVDQGRHPGDIAPPRLPPAGGGLGSVDLRVRGGVDHHVVAAEVEAGHGPGIAQVEFGPGQGGRAGQRGRQRPAELAARPQDRRPSPGGPGALERHHLGQPRVPLVGVRQLSPLERDRPIDGHRLVGQIEERVGLPGRGTPVIVDEVGVRGAVHQGLERVADAARHEHRLLRTHPEAEHRAEALPGSQVHPGAEDLPGRHRHELVPRLGVDAAGRTGEGVEGDVVLHRPEVRQPGGDHLLPLPVLLEPAAIVASHVEVDDEQPRNRRRRDGPWHHLP